MGNGEATDNVADNIKKESVDDEIISEPVDDEKIMLDDIKEERAIL